MCIKPVMFLLALQLINAAPWALAEEQQVVVPIPAPANPLPQPTSRQVVWEAGKVIHVSGQSEPDSGQYEQGMMPLSVGELLRVEPSMPITGARASWLAFSISQISLCAMKLATPDVICRELDVLNMAGTTITIEPRGPAGHFALRYRYRIDDPLKALLETPLLIPMAHAMAQEISAASGALGETLTGKADTPK